MKWINHKAITFSVVYLLTGNFLSSCVAAAGSIIPDLLEGWKSKDKNTPLPKWHRTVTHWTLPYFLILLFSYLSFREVNGINVTNLAFYVGEMLSGTTRAPLYFALFWLSFGSLMHVIEDSLTGKVPLINPFKKSFTLKVMKTGSPAEYLLSLLLAGIALLVYVKS